MEIVKEASGIRTIFWGTPEFAIPAFEALVNSGYSVVAAVTNPDEPKGRKQILIPPPVKVFVEKRGIPFLQPRSLSGFAPKLRELNADIFVVAAYGKIIPKEILDMPKYGSINIHPSLLPRWRGPSPIQHSILAGDKETGVTLIAMDEKMDHGPIVATRRIELGERKAGYKELHDELAALGAELLIEILPGWIRGEITLMPQDDAQATYSKIIGKDDGKIDWQKSVLEIERMIRAFSPWPSSFTFWQRNQNRLRLEIEGAEAIEKNQGIIVPGSVWKDETGALFVQTGKGNLRIMRIHPEGRKAMTAEEFLNGYSDIVGSVLDSKF